MDQPAFFIALLSALGAVFGPVMAYLITRNRTLEAANRKAEEDRRSEIRSDFEGRLLEERNRADKWEAVALEGLRQLRHSAEETDRAMRTARYEREELSSEPAG